MNSTLLNTIARFILLLIAQIALFNNIDFLGYINPFPYILFIILYPINGNKAGLLLFSFFLGLIMDLFMDSGGVHTTACLILAFYRPYFFRFCFGLSYEYQTVKINDVLTPERFSFIFLSVVFHQIFTLEFFWSIILKTLVSTLFTLVICILIIYLIKPKKR